MFVKFRGRLFVYGVWNDYFCLRVVGGILILWSGYEFLCLFYL